MSSKSKILLGAAAVVVVIAGIVVVNRGGTRANNGLAVSTRKGGAPNIVVIMTDDQTLESMRVMTNVNALIGAQGTTFTNYFSSFPNCCPSRATYLTGQFSHNNGVQDNLPPFGGFKKLKSDETLPVWLHRAGYQTTHIGKYLNTWGSDGNIGAPPGWDHWFGLIDPSTYHYYNYSVSIDGVKRDYGTAEEDYQTDVLGAEAVRVITEGARSDKPWFVSLAPLAPHAQERETADGGANEAKRDPSKFGDTFPTPANKYKGTMAAEALPKPPSYNQKDVSRSPAWVQALPPIGKGTEALIEQEYRQELESLKSVDEWVGKIFETLTQTKQLDNTVVLFTSDNGFYHGEHRIGFVKFYLYEPGVHLPLLARGGPFTAGKKVEDLVGNVDLASTILKLAGATSPLTLDGRDIAPLVANPGKGKGRGMLLENLGKKGSTHTEGIRTERFKYLTNERGEEELYDLKIDPDETDNRAADPEMARFKQDLADRLTRLKACKGTECEGAGG